MWKLYRQCLRSRCWGFMRFQVVDACTEGSAEGQWFCVQNHMLLQLHRQGSDSQLTGLAGWSSVSARQPNSRCSTDWRYTVCAAAMTRVHEELIAAGGHRSGTRGSKPAVRAQSRPCRCPLPMPGYHANPDAASRRLMSVTMHWAVLNERAFSFP